MIGETLSHFKIVSKIGQGGMGIVYRGVDLNLDRPVAIKILPPESQGQEESTARFLREAKTASKLQHPAITTIYEFGTKDNFRYLVMEYIEGQTLRSMLNKGPLPLRQALDIAIQAADALALASEKDIIHRDIKSENIMVTERGQVKILDFGLAKMVERKTAGTGKDTFQTGFGLVMGTVTYMSPEQALGADLDPRTDIYSLGVVLYEMISGRLPFVGDNASVVLAKVLNQPPPPLNASAVDLPLSLQLLVARCLEKNRDDRYWSGKELLADLKKVKQEVEAQSDLSGTVLLQRTPPEAAAGESIANLVAGGRQSGAAAAAADPAAMASSGTLALRKTADATTRPRVDVWRAPVSFGIRGVRRLLGLCALGYILASLTLFVLPLFKPERIMNSVPVGWAHMIADPAAALVSDLVDFHFSYRNFNFLFLGLAFAAYLLYHFISGRLEWMDSLIRKPLALAAARSSAGGTSASGGVPMAATPDRAMRAQDASRMSLLRQYADARRILGEAGKRLAFLSVDVAGSTRMKVGEDRLVIEHTFAEYKKFLEHIFYKFHIHKVAWTPDGVMACFPSVDEGVGAARKILVDLDWFNSGVNQLRTPFRVRCGLNFGEVLVPEDKPLEHVSDHIIDVAGHMQKEAAENALWISDRAYDLLTDKTGFQRLDRTVDNHAVFSLQLSAKVAGTAS